MYLQMYNMTENLPNHKKDLISKRMVAKMKKKLLTNNISAMTEK